MKIASIHRHRQTGFSLLEVLVSIVVLSLGLLGFAGLQVASIKNSASAYQRSQATILAHDIIDRMRVNRIQAVSGSYNTTVGATPGAGASIAAQDLAEWKTRVGSALPAGDAAVNVDANGSVLVTIQWADKRDRSAGVNPTVVFNTQTVI